MLNRPRLIEAFRDEFETTQASATRAVDWLFDQMENELAQGGTVSLKGFGKFDTYQGAPRDGRNPHTGEIVKVPAKTRVRFSAGKALKERVNQG